jgi:hypothetical protein
MKKPMSFNISIQEPKYYDKVFKELSKSKYKNYSHSKLKKIIYKEFEGIPIFVNILREGVPDLTVYRITGYEPTANERDLPKSYSYNPTPPLGRANLKNIPVFYCSLEPTTAISEMKGMNLKNCYISRWRIKFNKTNIAILSLGINQEEETTSTIFESWIKEATDNMMAGLKDKKYKHWLEYKLLKFCDLFTQDGTYYYYLSSAIAHSFLYDSFEQKADIPILAYPSITKNKRDINFAIRKDAADNQNFMTLETVVKCDVISEDEKGCQTKFSEKGFMIDGRLVWKKPIVHLKKLWVEKVWIGLYCQKKLIEVESDQLMVSCGGYQGTLKDYIITHQTKCITNALKSNNDCGFKDHDYMDLNSEYENSMNATILLNRGLTADLDGKHDIKYLIVRVDFDNRFE